MLRRKQQPRIKTEAGEFLRTSLLFKRKQYPSFDIALLKRNRHMNQSSTYGNLVEALEKTQKLTELPDPKMHATAAFLNLSLLKASCMSQHELQTSHYIQNIKEWHNKASMKENPFNNVRLKKKSYVSLNVEDQKIRKTFNTNVVNELINYRRRTLHPSNQSKKELGPADPDKNARILNISQSKLRNARETDNTQGFVLQMKMQKAKYHEAGAKAVKETHWETAKEKEQIEEQISGDVDSRSSFALTLDSFHKQADSQEASRLLKTFISFRKKESQWRTNNDLELPNINGISLPARRV